MYIVRVDFKNGLHLEFNFGGGQDKGLGRAESIRRLVAEGLNMSAAIPPKPAVCEVFDDAGRQGNIDCAQVQSVGLIDLESETIAAIRIKQFVQGLAMKHDPQAFRQPPQEMDNPAYNTRPANGAEPPPAPAIGGQFSA